MGERENRNTAHGRTRKPQYRTWENEKTAIPHMGERENRNIASKFTQIWEKVAVVKTTDPPFQ